MYNLDNLINKINEYGGQKKIASDLGMPQSSLSDLLNKDKPLPKSIIKLCKLKNYFNCSLDFLLGLEIENNNSEIKESIVNILDKLNSIGLEKAREKIEELSKIPKYTLENDNIDEEISITTDTSVVNIKDFKKVKFYNTPVSAGQGSFISDYEDYEIVNVDLKLVPQARRCDFALRIKGDSMEPNYYNGDTVFIKEQPSLDNGQIGIFIYDGEAYIKKYVINEEGVYLVSLNKKYPPIKIKEYSSFKICGIVL